MPEGPENAGWPGRSYAKPGQLLRAHRGGHHALRRLRRARPLRPPGVLQAVADPASFYCGQQQRGEELGVGVQGRVRKRTGGAGELRRGAGYQHPGVRRGRVRPPAGGADGTSRVRWGLSDHGGVVEPARLPHDLRQQGPHARPARGEGPPAGGGQRGARGRPRHPPRVQARVQLPRAQHVPQLRRLCLRRRAARAGVPPAAAAADGPVVRPAR
mmetsp:Transcript_79390/g.215007  ORF Transcript_79390/g.215007 Transcript_79390/m.215007 type:complete len:214 (+) Transcript_79390:1469-2110(+)